MSFWGLAGNDPWIAMQKQIEADMQRTAQEVQRMQDAVNAQILAEAEAAKKADEANKKKEEENWAKIQADIQAQNDRIIRQMQNPWSMWR
jgi:membrane protein involved in colicin uptake